MNQQLQITPEQIQEALNAGLINEEDANFLMQQTQSSSYAGPGAALGGTLGAAGGGIAGAQLLDNSIEKGLGVEGKTLGNIIGEIPEQLQGVSKLPVGKTAGAALGALGGALGGGLAGLGLGSLIDKSPEGLDPMKTAQAALAVIFSPESSKEQRAEAAELLHQLHQLKTTEDEKSKIPSWAVPTGAALGGAVGGGLLGSKLLAMLQRAGQEALPEATAEAIKKPVSAEAISAGLGGILGGGVGLGVGNYLNPFEKTNIYE